MSETVFHTAQESARLTPTMLPCPFCGSEDVDATFALSGGGKHSAGCMTCSAMASESDTVQGAVDVWNKIAAFADRERVNDAIWDALRKQFADGVTEDHEEILEVALAHGKVQRLEYDPELHSDLGLDDYEAGDYFWHWGDPTGGQH